jgi:hypothetical protein
MTKRKMVVLVEVILLGCLNFFGCAAPEPSPPSVIEVSFYGDYCQANAPSELPAGKYPFILYNLDGEYKAELYVGIITGGHTFQELLDPQKSPGEYYPKPDWLIYATKMGQAGGDENEKHYKITLDPGEHAIYVAETVPFDAGWTLWFCQPVTVVEPDTN